MRRAAALAACALMAACASVGGATAPAPLPGGYLDEAALERFAGAFVPTPLVRGSEPSDHADFATGTDRWYLAIAHAELRPPEAAQHFDCVLGTRLGGAPRPALSRLMTRLLSDTEAVTRRLADRHPRQRPIAANRDLQPCQRITEATRASPSWPASGAVAGAAYGEMFARLVPHQADALRARGADIGFSRAICRMNWTGDVDDGAAIGRAVFEQAALTQEFAADLEAARAEVVAARTEGLTNPSCAAERLALRSPRY